MLKPSIDRERILTVLVQWQEGSLTEKQVQEFAESLTDEHDFPELPHHDDESIAIEVLLYLDALPALLVTKQDIPAMIEFLRTLPGHAEEGWRTWFCYWKSLDEGRRREDVRANPFYFT